MTPDKPWFLQRSFWLSVAAALSGLPTFLEPFLPLMPERWRQFCLALGIALAAMSARYARRPGARAQNALAEQPAPAFEVTEAEAVERLTGTGGGAEET